MKFHNALSASNCEFRSPGKLRNPGKKNPRKVKQSTTIIFYSRLRLSRLRNFQKLNTIKIKIPRNSKKIPKIKISKKKKKIELTKVELNKSHKMVEFLTNVSRRRSTIYAKHLSELRSHVHVHVRVSSYLNTQYTYIGARVRARARAHTHTHRGQSETHTTIRIELTPKRKPIVSMGHVYDRSSTCLLSARHDLLLYTIYYLRIFIPRLPNGAIPAHTHTSTFTPRKKISSKNTRDSRNPKVANEFFF